MRLFSRIITFQAPAVIQTKLTCPISDQKPENSRFDLLRKKDLSGYPQPKILSKLFVSIRQMSSPMAPLHSWFHDLVVSLISTPTVSICRCAFRRTVSKSASDGASPARVRPTRTTTAKNLVNFDLIKGKEKLTHWSSCG